LTGRRIIALAIPVLLMRGIGKLCDWIKAVYPLQVSVTSESVAIVTQWPVASSDKILALTGVSFRSGEETFADTIEWLAQQGHIPGNLAGKLANQMR
jgi:hypothetical protein